jgi:hypothetical protein
MIWVVRQFITHQILEIEGETVKFPIRVELEYQEENGKVSFASLHKKVLYNKSFLLRRYPQVKERELELLVEEKTKEAIQDELIPFEGTE